MRPLKIGILGGIGPEATGIFYLKLIKKLQKEGLIRKNEDYPQILINSIPAPELIFNKKDEPDLRTYERGLYELDQMKPDFIVMICNTIHLYHKNLQSKITTELIDLRKEVENRLKSLNLKKITIIGTPITIASDLYKFEDMTYLNPNKKEIKELGDAIINFNKGVNKNTQKKKVEKIAMKYLSQGSQIVLLACTEFAVMLDSTQIQKMNTIDVLVECVIERYQKRQIF